jgi:hypothetical protein
MKGVSLTNYLSKLYRNTQPVCFPPGSWVAADQPRDRREPDFGMPLTRSPRSTNRRGLFFSPTSKGGKYIANPCLRLRYPVCPGPTGHREDGSHDVREARDAN